MPIAGWKSMNLKTFSQVRIALTAETCWPTAIQNANSEKLMYDPSL
jgi:hypothetical protein